MEIRMEMDEGFHAGWNIELEEPLDDEDVIYFERQKARVVYRKSRRAESR